MDKRFKVTTPSGNVVISHDTYAEAARTAELIGVPTRIVDTEEAQQKSQGARLSLLQLKSRFFKI